MKTALIIPVIAALALPVRGAEPLRVPAAAKPVVSSPYPPQASSRNIEGNVVLTGEVSAAGEVKGLKVLASSSPELSNAAVEFVGRWKFSPAQKNGIPVAVILNAVVRFRKDKRARAGGGLDPGTMPSPMVGNLVLSPAGPAGQSKRLEGFAVERGDRGIAGLLDLDLPRSPAVRSYRVAVTDVLPSGKVVPLDNRVVTGGGGGDDTVTLSFHRDIDPDRSTETGTHLIRVTVDGRDAGGGVYRVDSKAAKGKTRKAAGRGERGLTGNAG